ncbi:MAG: hypothetical protein V3T90_04550, partial [Anaerolineae bacterium]
FLTHYWAFYGQLLVYRGHPTAEDSTRLTSEFDELFSTVTGYDALDERITKTRAKKASIVIQSSAASGSLFSPSRASNAAISRSSRRWRAQMEKTSTNVSAQKTA